MILTGASRGFGKYLARRLWDEGASLLLVVRNPLDTYRFTDGIEGQLAIWTKADLSFAPDVEVVLSDWQGYHIDGLVNNAAIQGPVGPAWENDWWQWFQTLSIDLLAPVLLSRLVIPQMLKQGHGKIVNLSGGGATSVRPNYSAYATAKTGLVRFSECLASELAGTGIDVNCVAPGKMPTDMLPEGETADEDAMQKAAELVVFLLSDESDGITGKLLSAKWDNWEDVNFKTMLDEHPGAYTLRRVTT